MHAESESLPALFLMSARGTVLRWSPEAESLSGFCAAEVVGRHWQFLFGKSTLLDLDTVERAGRTVVRGALHRRDGATTSIQVDLTRLGRPGNSVFAAALGPVDPERACHRPRDLGDETVHGAARVLPPGDDRAALYRAAIETTPDGFFLVDMDGRFVESNDAYRRMSGYAPGELAGLSIQDVEAVESPEAIADRLRLVQSRGWDRFESWHRRKDRAVFPVEISAAYWPVQGGRYIAFVRDITQRKRAEEDLRASEARFRSFVEHANEAFFLHEYDGRLIDVNTRTCESLGYTREELIGTLPFDWDANVTKEVLDDVLARLDAGERFHFESTHLRKDGTTFPVEIRITPFWVQGRRLAVASAIDISERNRAQQALRLQALVLESLLEGVCVMDQDGVIVYANPAECSMFGYEQGELIGKSYRVFQSRSHTGGELAEHELYAALQATGVWVGRLLGRRKDGSDVLTFTRVSRIAGAGGTPYYVSVREDITERNRMTEHIRQLELEHMGRLLTLGEMAGMIAHQLHQPLTAISNYAEVLRQRLQGLNAPQCVAVSEKIQAATLQAGELISRIRRFVEKRGLRMSTVDLTKALQEVVSLCEARVRSANAQVQLEVEPALPTVIADSVQIQQVIVNLLINAIEAVDVPQIVERRIRVIVRRADDNVELAVQDSGRGVPREEFDRLFEPFYTTKETGSGMGLPISRHIVHAHGGQIWFDREASGGAVVRFTLPISRGGES